MDSACIITAINDFSQHVLLGYYKLDCDAFIHIKKYLTPEVLLLGFFLLDFNIRKRIAKHPYYSIHGWLLSFLATEL